MTVVGDLKHNRMVHSLVRMLALYQGVKIYYVAPESLCMPADVLQELTEKGIEQHELTGMHSFRFSFFGSIFLFPFISFFYFTYLPCACLWMRCANLWVHILSSFPFCSFFYFPFLLFSLSYIYLSSFLLSLLIYLCFYSLYACGRAAGAHRQRHGTT